MAIALNHYFVNYICFYLLVTVEMGDSKRQQISWNARGTCVHIIRSLSLPLADSQPVFR